MWFVKGWINLSFLDNYGSKVPGWVLKHHVKYAFSDRGRIIVGVEGAIGRPQVLLDQMKAKVGDCGRERCGLVCPCRCDDEKPAASVRKIKIT